MVRFPKRPALREATRHYIVEAVWTCRCHEFACEACGVNIAAIMEWGMQDVQCYLPSTCKSNSVSV